MRKIRFRAWSQKHQFMDYDFFIHASGKTYEEAASRGDTKNLEIEKYEDLIVMLCAETVDKRGTLIFEGDLLKFEGFMDGETKIFVREIRWLGGSELLVDINDDIIINIADLDPPIEVIGNVYEHPELINLQDPNKELTEDIIKSARHQVSKGSDA